MPAQKLRKDGTPKRIGLQEGDRRMGRALSLKLQVVDEYRLRQRQKADGQCCAPLDKTAKKIVQRPQESGFQMGSKGR